MAAGISTSKRNFDDPNIDWSNFDIWRANWPELLTPEFGGRYFLGGKFEQPYVTSHEINCIANWSCGELFNSAIVSDMLYIVPIQAGIKARLESSDKDGRLAGKIDAKRFCERIQAAITIGDFVFPEQSKSIYIFLDVESGTTLSKYYWQSWAAEIVSFILLDDAGQIVRPFLPCILCDFELDESIGKYVPSINDVQTCLMQLLIRDGKSYKQCHGFWARTIDKIVPSPSTPEIGSDIFASFPQVFDTHSTAVPIFFWQFAIPDETDSTIAGLNLSVNNGSISMGDCALQHSGWDSSTVSPTIFGFDTDIPTIATPEILSPPAPKHIDATTDQTSCIHGNSLTSPWPNSPAEGGVISFVGRYYKQNEHLNDKKRLTATEIQELTDKGLNIISIFQANNRKDDTGTFFISGWGDAGVKYFAHGFSFGVLDGYDACRIANNWNSFCPGVEQRDRTPIYFGIDYDPEFPYTTNADGSISSNVDAATIEERMQALEEYMKGLAAGFQQFHDEGGGKYFDIGIYGVRHVLERLYPFGIISHFWQLKTGPQPDFFRHANMVQTDLPFYHPTDPSKSIIPKVCTLDSDFDISWGAEGSWNSKTEFTNP